MDYKLKNIDAMYTQNYSQKKIDQNKQIFQEDMQKRPNKTQEEG